MPRRRGSKRSGFTLIEVLVALAIISIALLSALRAAGQGTNNVGELRSRLLAGWVAENLLAEHRARRRGRDVGHVGNEAGLSQGGRAEGRGDERDGEGRVERRF